MPKGVYIKTEEHKKKLSEAKLGKKPSDETRKKLSLAHSGEKNSFYGKHHSDKAKEEIRRVHLGLKASEETKEKMRTQITWFENENGCHICTSHKQKMKADGSLWHPAMRRNNEYVYIHRFLYEQAHGKIPDGLCVCHSCDDPRCINIEHFFLGSKAENTLDMVNKNRQAKGETNGKHKLTEAQVLEIFTSNENLEQLAQKNGVCVQAIMRIKAGKNWKYLTNPLLNKSAKISGAILAFIIFAIVILLLLGTMIALTAYFL
jgi:hypothetical protein